MQDKNIVWLASYPKSGNTWFRAFLSALLNDDGELNINGLKMNIIFSSREVFEAFTDIDSTYLYDEEVKELLPEVYKALSAEALKTQYIKVHDAYTNNRVNKPIIPTEATRCAIYIIRNPLDIVASFANHQGKTTAHALRTMNNPAGSLSPQANNLNTNVQLRQLMLSWSEHVKSWTTNSPFPVLVIRYEDILSDPLTYFTKAVQFLELNSPSQEIERAIAASSFDALKQKEATGGFKEKGSRSEVFFRSGKSGNWKNELTKEQARSIIDHHSEVMKLYGYDVNIED